jgi:hypothetical protein
VVAKAKLPAVLDDQDAKAKMLDMQREGKQDNVKAKIMQMSPSSREHPHECRPV